jgi:hypothetical protein
VHTYVMSTCAYLFMCITLSYLSHLQIRKLFNLGKDDGVHTLSC